MQNKKREKMVSTYMFTYVSLHMYVYICIKYIETILLNIYFITISHLFTILLTIYIFLCAVQIYRNI